jgi:putative PIN family toxin of toxin-antitoxin system
MPLRLVLDTNIWLDWLVFDDPGIAAIRTALASGRVDIFIDAACKRELTWVLASSLAKNAIDATAQAACLAECRRLTQMGGTEKRESEMAGERNGGRLPVCRDPNDQKFLDLARDCGADFLVTRDFELLVLARRKLRRPPFLIVTPQQFADALSRKFAGE